MKLRFLGNNHTRHFNIKQKSTRLAAEFQSHAAKAKQDKCLYLRIDENPTLDVGSVLPHNASGQGQL